MNIITIGIIDDQILFVKALEKLLNNFANFEVIQTAINKDDYFSKYCLGEFPDLLLIGINRFRHFKPKELQQLIDKFPESNTIALNALKDQKLIAEIILSGVNGVVSKYAKPSELAEAIHTAYKGGLPFNDESLRVMREQYSRRPKKSTGTKSGLEFTQKELEIINLICNELTNTEICDSLQIAKKTVEAHKRNIIAKMGVKNSVGIAVYALRNELIFE